MEGFKGSCEVRSARQIAATVELELSLFVITQSANHQGIFLPVPASCLLHPIPHRLKSLILPDTSNPILHLNSIQTKQNTLHQTQWHLSSLETSSPRESSSGEYHHSHLRHTAISIESLCHGDSLVVHSELNLTLAGLLSPTPTRPLVVVPRSTMPTRSGRARRSSLSLFLVRYSTSPSIVNQY